MDRVRMRLKKEGRSSNIEGWRRSNNNKVMMKIKMKRIKAMILRVIQIHHRNNLKQVKHNINCHWMNSSISLIHGFKGSTK